MNNKLKSAFTLLWILFFYLSHYYFVIKKYLILVPNYIKFF